MVNKRHVSNCICDCDSSENFPMSIKVPAMIPPTDTQTSEIIKISYLISVCWTKDISLYISFITFRLIFPKIRCSTDFADKMFLSHASHVLASVHGSDNNWNYTIQLFSVAASQRHCSQYCSDCIGVCSVANSIIIVIIKVINSRLSWWRYDLNANVCKYTSTISGRWW